MKTAQRDSLADATDAQAARLPGPAPLTDDEIKAIAMRIDGSLNAASAYIAFARAIESKVRSS